MTPKRLTIKKVTLGDHHLKPGRTAHSIVDRSGTRPFPPFVSLAITNYYGGIGFYQTHLCADGSTADTWHESLDDALHQAEWELGVAPAEWIDPHESR
jgi:hypothetical protein